MLPDDSFIVKLLRVYRFYPDSIGSRQKKVDLINEMNPAWVDLYEEI